jgi:arylsulfatase B
MREFYEAWWLELEPTFAQTTEIVLGHRDHAVVSLTGHDWIQKSLPPWNQRHIRNGHMSQPKRGEARAATARHEGHWAVKVVETGEYEVEMRRWPVEANQPIRAALPPGADVPGATKAFRAVEGKGLDIVRATLRVNGKSLGESAVEEAATQVRFQTRLEAGSHELSPVFHTATGDEVGAYYAVVRRVP